MYAGIFQSVGLSKNESQIYEALLSKGESSVGEIVAASGVYHRNVYDSLHRLLEKGLVLEIVQSKENRYQAVDPQKLVELIDEDRQVFLQALPGMQELLEKKPEPDHVHVYRGTEGCKTYLRDVLRIGEDLYVIGDKGLWAQPGVRPFIPGFLRDAKRAGISFHFLLDHETREQGDEILSLVGPRYKFIPPEYSSGASAHIFGAHVALTSSIECAGPDSDLSFAVSINRRMADSFRAWFAMIWDLCPDSGEEG